MRIRHSVLVIPFIALLASARSVPAPATVVLLVRHAERAPVRGRPDLEVGRARAMALADLGKVTGVSVIITTQLQRTRQTAAPLAEALGITPLS
jgi:broad specificity phosphatase PhoE